jgi:rhodanese-related sulfurtransferase
MKIRFLFPLIFLSGCFWSSHVDTVVVPKGTVLVSVLDPASHNDCHIPESVHLDLDTIERYCATLPKDTRIILYCSNLQCTTSEYVAQKISKMGFPYVFVYAHGIADWYQHGLPVTGACKAQYLKAKEKNGGEQVALPEGIFGISTRELADILRVKLVSKGAQFAEKK